ncbi:MAG: nucleoside monophosphate kinase [Acidobacteriota bacterium]|nr:nucleoside monophosphate kinase [Acidobacteriota bacterium]
MWIANGINDANTAAWADSAWTSGPPWTSEIEKAGAFLESEPRGTVMYKQPKAIIFLGPPGSGKGTQAARLAAALDIPAISTGDILRRECHARTALGMKVEAVLQTGQLVSNTLMNQVVENRLHRKDCRGGCILDGFPRTVEQARFLSELLRRLRAPEPLVFDFAVSAEDLIERLRRRRQCPTCGRIYSLRDGAVTQPTLCDNDRSLLMPRSDDQPEAIRERLWSYEQNAAELVRCYERGDYHRVAAARAPEQVTCQLLEVLGLGTMSPQVAAAGGYVLASC